MMTHKELGEIAGLLALVPTPFYIYSIVKGHIKPSAVTWFVWTVVGGLLYMNYKDSGATHTLWAPLVYIVGPFINLVFSLVYAKPEVTGFDMKCLVAALLTMPLRMVMNSPEAAMTMLLVIDFFGALPTIRKVWLNPRSESKWAWALTLPALPFNIAAIDQWSYSNAVYPIYMVIPCATITLLTFVHLEKRLPRRLRKQIARTLTDDSAYN
jgi:hypothetical protein